MQGKDRGFSRLILGLVILGLLFSGGVSFFEEDGVVKFGEVNVQGADFFESPGRYPNTETCANTPTIQFPTATTISKEYLFITECDTPADFNTGDFVTAWIEDVDGSPIQTISKYQETDSGIVWVSPLSDNQGQAWERIVLSPEYYDCNSSGVPYTIKLNWDGETAEQEFKIYCPTIEFTYYREDVPYWEQFRIEVSVTDNQGYTMRGIPCKATVLEYSTDGNFATIKQENLEEFTDISGKARFNFNTGVIQDLLQGFEYTTVVNCLGADANIVFEIVQTDDTNLRNPVYFTIVFLSDNIIPIVLALIVCTMVVGGIYFILKKE